MSNLGGKNHFKNVFDVLANEFGSEYVPEQFTDLPNSQIWVKLLNCGEYGEPFLGKTAPPVSYFHGHCQNLMKRSRERFGTRRDLVESKIRRWLQN